jgi:putative oxidoreductase
LQRLFSTFAGGWPGIGLLLQRLLTATALLYYGFPHLGPQLTPILPQMIAASAGIPLLVGLWTPMAGTLVAIVEVWIAFISIMLATLGATLAMIGPGAWSIDARLFGRKHIETLGR